MKATDGRVADWDEFTHLVLKDEFWSHQWERIEIHDRYVICDSSGIYFKAIDSEGFVYLAAPVYGELIC